MAVQLIEGFESGDRDGILNVVPGGGGISTTTAGPWSHYSYGVGASGQWAKGLKTQTATELFIAFRLWRNTNNQTVMQAYHPDGSSIGGVSVGSTGVLSVFDSGGTTRGTGSTVLPLNTWQHIECRIKIGDAATGIMQVRILGLTTNEIDNTTTADTKNGSNTVFGTVRFNDAAGAWKWDDIIIYDTTGSRNNTWIGDKGVEGRYLDGQGTQEQWSIPATSANRFYFPNYQLTADSATIANSASRGTQSPVSVTPAAEWDVTTSVGATVAPSGVLLPYKAGTAITAFRAASGYTSTAGQDVLVGQYISPAIAAQTITGTVKMQMQMSNPSLSNDLRSQLIVRVVSQDGTTVRGTLYAGDTGSMTDEWGSSYANDTFPQATISPVSMSSVTAVDGDRICVEFGYRSHTGTLTGGDVRVRLGDTGASGDLPDESVQTAATYAPWIEFSNAITMSDNTNWQFLDEAYVNSPGTADDAANTQAGQYVTTSTDNDLDLYSIANGNSAYTVNGALSIKTRAKKNDPGSRSLTHAYKTSGGTQVGSAIGLGTTYAVQETLLDEDATDSAAWTDAKVNAMEIGIKAT